MDSEINVCVQKPYVTCALPGGAWSGAPAPLGGRI